MGRNGISSSEKQSPGVSLPSEERQDGREEDVDFAHIAAFALNQLIDEGVLTSESVSNASRETMEEFALRSKKHLAWVAKKEFSHSEMGGGEEAEYKLGEGPRVLLRTMFGISPREQGGESESNPTREETIKIMESLLPFLRNRGIAVDGILLYGSRMDPDKSPRGVEYGEHGVWSILGDSPYMSDVDAIAIVREGNWEKLRAKLTDAVFEFQAENPNIPQVQINLEIGSPTEIFTPFSGRIADEVPYWAWKSKAPLYIGWPLQYFSEEGVLEMKDHSPQKVNERLQEFLNSKALREAKDRVIAKIKVEVKRSSRAVPSPSQ